MRNFLLSALACFLVLTPTVALAQSSCDRALRTVLTNTAKQGYLAARAEYDTDCLTGPEFVAASRRVLEAQSGRLFGGPYSAVAAKEHLQTAERVRRGTDVSKTRLASIADYDYQIARAIVASSDPRLRPIWEANIQDLCRLQGIWIKIQDSDQPAASDASAETDTEETLEIIGGIATLTSSLGTSRGFITLSSKLSPPHFDLYGFDYDINWGLTAIYELRGDTLRIAHAEGTNIRPKNFNKTTEPDGSPGSVVETFRRHLGPRRPRPKGDIKLPWDLGPADQ